MKIVLNMSLALTVLCCLVQRSECCETGKITECYTKNLQEGNPLALDIIELLRKIFREGIPDLGIPPLDPLQNKGNESVSFPELSGVLTPDHLELGDYNITGLSNFTADDLSLNLFGLTLTFDLTFSLVAKANYIDFRIIVADFVPFFGTGTLDIITDLRLNGTITLNGKWFEVDRIVELKTVKADVSLDPFKFEVSNIMDSSGTILADRFNTLLSEVIPEIVAKVKDDVVDSLKEQLNSLFVEWNLTLSDLTNCLLSGECPFSIFS